jgi:hypothetical protein
MSALRRFLGRVLRRPLRRAMGKQGEGDIAALDADLVMVLKNFRG